LYILHEILSGGAAISTTIRPSEQGTHQASFASDGDSR
jgi:hypothetical protein